MKQKDASSLLETHLQHLHLWGLLSSKSQCNERQRDIWRKRKPANKNGGYGHPHQQTLQMSRLWLQFCGRIRQERKECYACWQPTGWKARPLKDLQDPHTLHPVTKLEHLHIPKVVPESSPQPSHTAPWWVWLFISYTRSTELWKSELSLITTCMCVHIDLEEEGIKILLLTKESDKLQTTHMGSQSWTWMLQNPTSFEFRKFEEKTSRLNWMPDQSSFDQMLVAVDSSCSCCYTLEFLLPGSMFGKKICLQGLCIGDNASPCCWVFGYSCSCASVIIFLTFLPFCERLLRSLRRSPTGD